MSGICGNDEKYWINAQQEFREIDNGDSLERFMDARKISHDVYFHYTSVDNCNNIMKSKQIWLSSISKANDVAESDAATKSERLLFDICMSAPLDKSERMNMWYLYTLGKGVCLKVKPALIKLLTYKAKTSKKILIMQGNEIVYSYNLKDNDYDICARDVLYYKKYRSSNSVETRCHNISNYILNQQQLKRYEDSGKIDNHFFVKDMCWNEENEFRILLALSINLTKIIKEKMNDKCKCVVTINLSNECINGIHCIAGPESNAEYTRSILCEKIRIPLWKG